MTTKRYLGIGTNIDNQSTPSQIVFNVPLNPATGEVSPDGAQAVRSANRTPKGYQQITNAQLIAVQTLGVPAGAVVAVIQNNGSQPVRYTDDDTKTPTATFGMRLQAGDEIPYVGDLSKLKLIREADGASLDISYYA